jgi:Cdc6-like AAA superfamily ATPase
MSEVYSQKFEKYFSTPFNSLMEAVMGMNGYWNIKSGSDIDDSAYAGAIALDYTLTADKEIVFYQENNEKLSTRLRIPADIFWKNMAKDNSPLQGAYSTLRFFPINDRSGKLEGRSEEIRRIYFIIFETKPTKDNNGQYFYPIGYMGINLLEENIDGKAYYGIEHILYWGSRDPSLTIEKFLHDNGERELGRVHKPASVNSIEAIGQDGKVILKEYKDEVYKGNRSMQSFYPWFNVGINDFMKEFMEDSANCMILYGDPGTGKSTFARTLIQDIACNALFSCTFEVTNHPFFIKSARDYFKNLRVETEDKFGFDTLKAKFFLREDEVSKQLPNLLIVEESDLLLDHRKKGNTNMQALLNEIDGIAKSSFKIIFITNLRDENDIDPALRRAGRCFEVIQFRQLTRNQADKIREDLGLEAVEWDKQEKKTFSLAEVIALQGKKRINSAGLVRSRFGFINGN